MEYAETRHNVGFKVVNQLARKSSLRWRSEKGRYRISNGFAGTRPVLYAKPSSYMNLSGNAVYSLVSKYEIDPANHLLIVCDDLNLTLGHLRFRTKGSDGGNKGLRSIIETLQTTGFHRLRIGIKTPSLTDNYPDFVLSEFDEDDYPVVERMIETAATAVECWIESGIDAAMNIYNQKTTDQEGE